MTNRSDETTADKAARRGMTPDEYRAHRHLAAVRQIRAALPGLYATTGLRVEAALTEPAVVEPPAGQTALRDRIRRAICEAEGFMWNEELLEPDEYGEVADAVLAVLPEPADRDAVLREAADHAETVALRLRIKHDVGAANGAYEVMTALRRLTAECPQCGTTGACNGGPCPLRRMADETATETPEPHRGDAFEQWLKARRDEWAPEGCQPWQILDQTLEEYRLHADTGTPLGEHVCEARVVGDCERLEQPAAGARQDGSQP